MKVYYFDQEKGIARCIDITSIVINENSVLEEIIYRTTEYPDIWIKSKDIDPCFKGYVYNSKEDLKRGNYGYQILSVSPSDKSIKATNEIKKRLLLPVYMSDFVLKGDGFSKLVEEAWYWNGMKAVQVNKDNPVYSLRIDLIKGEIISKKRISLFDKDLYTTKEECINSNEIIIEDFE